MTCMKTFDIDLAGYRIIDLSYEVVPPGTQDRPFRTKRGYLADRAFKHAVTTHSHVGTHVEAPAHFFAGGKDVCDLPLSQFLGRAVLLDVPEAKVAMAIGPEYLERAIGDIMQFGDIVICRNHDPESLRSARPEDKPCFVPAGARWLAARQVKMVGIDGHFRLGKDIEDGRAFHDILQSQDVCLVELLDNLSALSQRQFFFMALPWKVRKLDSSWARAIAIEAE